MSDRPKLDFQDIKARVSLEQVMQMLRLPVKKSAGQYRCACPVHTGSDRQLAITPSEGWYCFASKKGGDCIALYAHIRECNNYDAAKAISEHFGIGSAPAARPAAPPAVQRPAEATGKGMEPLSYLQYDHEALELLDLSPAVCEALGIGYAPKGTQLHRIVLPLVDMRLVPLEALKGYCGFATREDQSPTLKFPANLAERLGIEAEPVEEPKPEPVSRDQLRKILRVV